MIGLCWERCQHVVIIRDACDVFQECLSGSLKIKNFRTGANQWKELNLSSVVFFFGKLFALNPNASVLVISSRPLLSICRLLGASDGLFASSAFIFASTSSDQICLASSEHFKRKDIEQRTLQKFSRQNLDLSLLKRNILR